MYKFILICVIFSLASTSSAIANSTKLSLTVYENTGLGQVKDIRLVNYGKGKSKFNWDGLPFTVLTGTLSVTAPKGVQILNPDFVSAKGPITTIVANSNSKRVAPTEVHYWLKGLGVWASYKLNLSQAFSRANFSGIVFVNQFTERNFTNVENLNFVAGDIKMGQKIIKIPNDQWGGQGQIINTIESISDKRIYSFKNVDISKPINIFKPAIGIQYWEDVVANIQAGGNPQQLTFNSQYIIQNTKNNGLGIDLPAGQAQVFFKFGQKYTSAGSYRVTYALPNQNFTIRMTYPEQSINGNYIVLSRVEPPINQSYYRGFLPYTAKLKVNINNIGDKLQYFKLYLNYIPAGGVLTLSYNANYFGPRWKKINQTFYIMTATVPSKNTRSVFWTQQVV